MTQFTQQFMDRLRSQSWQSNVSVLTYGRGRDEQLANLMLGLESQTITPTELIICHLKPQAYSGLPETSFPVRQIHVSSAEDDLPLAAARNAAAKAAASSNLVFLDIDCIPAPRMVEDYTAALTHWDGILVGDVRYLREGGNAPGWTPHTLMLASEVHVERRLPPKEGIEPCADYRAFSSMSFAMRKKLFLESGGFDEQYSGYGAEDSDFSRKIAELGIAIGWCAGATSFHQFHLQHRPPVHRLRSVLKNNAIYRDKWGEDTMEHWLRAFERLGLVRRSDEGFDILRPVDDDDLRITRQNPHEAYASTRAFFHRIDQSLSPGSHFEQSAQTTIATNESIS